MKRGGRKWSASLEEITSNSVLAIRIKPPLPRGPSVLGRASFATLTNRVQFKINRRERLEAVYPLAHSVGEKRFPVDRMYGVVRSSAPIDSECVRTDRGDAEIGKKRKRKKELRQADNIVASSVER